MYKVGGEDHPREIREFPQSSVGAPSPMLLAGENSLRLAYYLEDRPEGWDGTAIRVLSPDEGAEPCVAIEFLKPYAHMFGPPNDEAFSGHPLASRGLRPCAVFEVEHSSWLATLERMNSVHPYHRTEHFAKYKHFVFAFHDTTFECIAEGFSIAIGHGAVRSVLLDARIRPDKSLERTREK